MFAWYDLAFGAEFQRCHVLSTLDRHDKGAEEIDLAGLDSKGSGIVMRSGGPIYQVSVKTEQEGGPSIARHFLVRPSARSGRLVSTAAGCRICRNPVGLHGIWRSPDLKDSRRGPNLVICHEAERRELFSR